MAKLWSGAPFGKQSTRFNINGLHPNLLISGHIPYEPAVVKQVSKDLGPGSYELLPYSEFSEKNVANRAEGPNWEQSLYTEKMAKIPHILFRDTYYKRKEYDRRLGPGSYNLKDGLETSETKPRSNRGMLDALSKRFSDDNFNDNPGPGAYGVPDEKVEQKKWTQGGKVPLFERSKQSRSLPFVGCEVPPGTYNHKSTIDELIKKKVSNRGPYDLFSINRSDPPKTGHYTNSTKWNLGPGQYEIPSFVEDLKGQANKKRGKFGKIDQYPEHSGDRLSIEHTSLQPHEPTFPGPAHYTPGDLSKFKTNLPGFLSTTSRNDKRSQKFFTQNYNSVGVGRYDMQKYDMTILEHDKYDPDNQKLMPKRNANRSVFVSKTSQITNQKDDKFIQERLKPHNLSKDQKENLYKTGNVGGRILTA